jgi:hypothetical protein
VWGWGKKTPAAAALSANFNGPIASLLAPAGSARLRIGNGCRARSQALSALSASAQLRLFHAVSVQYKQIKHGRAPRLGRSQHSAGCMYPARVCRAWACCWCRHQRGAKRRRQCKKHTELAKQQEVAVIDANNTDCYPTGGFTASACSCKVASTGMEAGRV